MWLYCDDCASLYHKKPFRNLNNIIRQFSSLLSVLLIWKWPLLFCCSTAKVEVTSCFLLFLLSSLFVVRTATAGSNSESQFHWILEFGKRKEWDFIFTVWAILSFRSTGGRNRIYIYSTCTQRFTWRGISPFCLFDTSENKNQKKVKYL